MRSFALLPVAFAAQVLAQTATPVTSNPVGVAYKASLPDKPFFKGADIEGNVKGYIEGVTAPDGKGVIFTVKFENLPAEGGPFGFHIHEAAAVNGNCTSTKKHLDPFGRTQQPPCDSSAIETCEVGDLSGKYGKIKGTSLSTTFTDHFASTDPESDSFFGDKSFVIHYANTTRLTCANFEKMAAAPAASVPKANCTTYTMTTVIASEVTISHPPTETPATSVTVPDTPEVPSTSVPDAPITSTVPPPVISSPPAAAAASLYFSAPLMIAGLAAAFFAL